MMLPAASNPRPKPPRDVERWRDLFLERSVLGAILVKPELGTIYLDAGLIVDYFALDAHRQAWEAIATLVADGTLPELPLVLRALRDAGRTDDVSPAHLTEIASDGLRVSADNARAHVEGLATYARCRRVYYSVERLMVRLAEEPAGVDDGLIAQFVDEVNRVPIPAPAALAGGETLPDLLRRIDGVPARPMLVGDLLARAEISMIHGEPRTGKSLFAQFLSICVAAGRTPFGLERFAVTEACPVLVVGNEDSAENYGRRARQLLAGLGGLQPPDRLHLRLGLSLSLDGPEGQDYLIREVSRLGIALLVLDPLRSVTAGADQGPGEWRPVSDFLRRLVRATGVAVLLDHHDVKPPAGARDTRRRGHRASGGGVFASADAPIHAVRVDASRFLFTPDSYKFSADPTPFVLVQDHSEGALTLSVEDAGREKAGTLEAEIRDYRKAHPDASGSKVAADLGRKKQDVLNALRRIRKSDSTAPIEGSSGPASPGPRGTDE